MDTRERFAGEKVRTEENGIEVDGTLARTLERRERHRGRSIFARAGVVAAGFGVGAVAVPLSIVAPEFGLPLLLFGLRLLALEFDWAARLYTKVARLAKKVAGSLRKMWPKSKVGVALTVLALVAVVYLVAIR
jgi:hypothetical protein